MRIDKCQIDRYGKLSKFSSSFSPGLNLIKGPNEAGKSTLVDALTDALFENPKTSKKDVKARTSWGFEKDFEITLDFESEGLSYSLSKDFDSGSVTLLKKSSGETLDDRKRVDRIVTSGLGLSNREIFLATTCIRQDEIARIATSPEAIRDRLEALITGGKEEALASRAIDRITAQIQDMKKSGYKNKGQLQRLEDDRKDFEYELDKAKREIETVKQNRAKLRDMRSNVEGLRGDCETKAIQKKNARLAAEVMEKKEQLEERFADVSSRINNIRNSEQVVERLRSQIANLPKVDRSDMNLAEEQAAQRRYLESKRESCEEQVDELCDKVHRARPGMALRLLTAVAFLGTAGLIFYWYKFTAMANASFLIGAGASFLLFVLFSVLWSARGKSCSQIRTQYQLKKSRLEEIKEDLAANSISIEAILGRYKTDDVDILKERYERRYELDKEIKSEINRYEGYLGDKTVRDLEDELKTVTRDLAVENEKSRELRPYVMDPESLAELERSLDRSQTSLSRLESEQKTLERQLDFAESGIEHLASLEERIEDIDVQLARKKHQLDVLERTQEFIENARKDVLKSTLKLLDDETSEMLREVTGGKYSQVRFDRRSLKFEVYSNEMGDWVEPAACLSRGTVDQLYLTARLALVKIISEDRDPVIILDDPFVMFDEERRKNALEVLKRFAERYQIFLLTCHDHYDGITENVITLS